MSELTHPLVVRARMTCCACPEQYEGLLIDGQWFYFRYRSGLAQLGIGPTVEAAVQMTVNNGRFSLRVGERNDGDFGSITLRDEVFADLIALAWTHGPKRPVRC